MKMEIAQGPILGLLASRVLVLIVGKDRSCYYPAKVAENQIGVIYFFGFSMVYVRPLVYVFFLHELLQHVASNYPL